MGMQKESFDRIKPEVTFRQIDRPGRLFLVNKMIEKGLVKPIPAQDTFEEEIEFWKLVGKISSCFYPHGLGHFMGIYTHDVGMNFWDGEKEEWSKNESLYTVPKFQEGMVFTVEPGCYFHKDLIETKKTEDIAEYLVFEEIEKWYSEGGVRIEDNVVVTKDGFEFLGQAPRTVEEIEQVMSGQ